MSVSSSSLYYTAEGSSVTNRSQATSIEDAVMGIGLNVLCKNPALTNNESKQVRFKLEKISNNSSLYTTIKINNRSYRVSVHQQNQNLSYAKEDWQKIANKVKDLVALTSSNGDFLKGTLKLQDRTWTPIFRTKNTQSKIAESSIQVIIKDIKLLFEQEIKPLNPLPKLPSLKRNSKNTLSSSKAKSTYSLADTETECKKPSSLENANLNGVTIEKKNHKDPFYKSTLQRILELFSSTKKTEDTKEPLSEEKEYKNSFYKSTLEKARGLFSSAKETEEQHEASLEQTINWKNQIKDYIFPSKDPDTLSQFDLTSDTTSVVEGSLTDDTSSDVLNDDSTKGFTLPRYKS